MLTQLRASVLEILANHLRRPRHMRCSRLTSIMTNGFFRSLVALPVIALAALTGCTSHVTGGSGDGGGGEGGGGGGGGGEGGSTACTAYEGEGCTPGETRSCSAPDDIGGGTFTGTDTCQLGDGCTTYWNYGCNTPL